MTTERMIQTPTPLGVRIPAVLALLAGITDVTSWILLGGLFTAHVTGNLVLVAADSVTGTTPRSAFSAGCRARSCTTIRRWR